MFLLCYFIIDMPKIELKKLQLCPYQILSNVTFQEIWT